MMFKHLNLIFCFGFRISIFGFATLLLIIPTIHPVAGQGAISPTLSISPGLVRQTVKPGEKTVIKIKVSNLGDDPIPLVVSKFSISGINNLGSPEFTTTPRPHSAVEWFAVDKPDLVLAPHDSQDVLVTIEPPSEAIPGGYSAALIFEARLPSSYFDSNANTRILPALSTSFLLSVEAETAPTIESLSISSFRAPKIVVSSPVPLLTEISNPTGFFFFTNGELTLKPTWGQSKIVTQLTGTILMPESSRQYTSAYTGAIWPGLYDAKLTLRQGDKVLVSSARFVSIPWPFVALVIIFTAVVVGVAFRLRRLKSQKPLAINTS